MSEPLLTCDPHEGVCVERVSAFLSERVDQASTERQLEVLLSFITALRMEMEEVDKEDDQDHYVRYGAIKRIARMICY